MVGIKSAGHNPNRALNPLASSWLSNRNQYREDLSDFDKQKSANADAKFTTV
jgi:triacylglycerol esterase/lipase EstA (alpha/beta hydrolase family)